MDIPLLNLLQIKYPSITIGRSGQVVLADQNDGNGPFISLWNVPGITQPTTDDIASFQADPSVQAAYQAELNNNLINSYTIQLQEYIDSVAQQKQYDNAISCISYINSTVQLWKDQAAAFIAWRDSVYNYVIAQEALMLSGSIPVPTFTQLQSELPVITWPTS